MWNEGVLSPWKGQHATKLFPCLFRVRKSPTTLWMSAASRIFSLDWLVMRGMLLIEFNSPEFEGFRFKMEGLFLELDGYQLAELISHGHSNNKLRISFSCD